MAITYPFTLLLTHRNLWSIEHIMSSLRSLCLSIQKSPSISYKTRNGETSRSLRRKAPSLAPARSLYSCPGQVTKVGQKILFSTRAGTLAAENHVIAKSGGVCMKARFKYQKFLFYDRILEIKGSFLTVLRKQWLI